MCLLGVVLRADSHLWLMGRNIWNNAITYTSYFLSHGYTFVAIFEHHKLTLLNTHAYARKWSHNYIFGNFPLPRWLNIWSSHNLHFYTANQKVIYVRITFHHWFLKIWFHSSLQEVSTVHFSWTCSVSLPTIGSRSLIFTSSFPPTSFLPSISYSLN